MRKILLLCALAVAGGAIADDVLSAKAFAIERELSAAAPKDHGAYLLALSAKYRSTRDPAVRKEMDKAYFALRTDGEATLSELYAADMYCRYADSKTRKDISSTIVRRAQRLLGSESSLAACAIARRYSQAQAFADELARLSFAAATTNVASRLPEESLAVWLGFDAALEADPWCAPAKTVAAEIFARPDAVEAKILMARFHPPAAEWLDGHAAAALERRLGEIAGEGAAKKRAEWLWAYWTFRERPLKEDWPYRHDREIIAYEPEAPRLDVPAGTTGLCGRVTGLVRITAANAFESPAEKKWQGTAWRNERIHGQVVVWTDFPVRQLRAEVAPFVAADGGKLAGESTVRFVRYTRASLTNWKGVTKMPMQLVGDILDPKKDVDLAHDGFRPIWLTVRVDRKARPGVYRSSMTVRGQGGSKVEFPLELRVVDREVPSPKDGKFHLELWQHPWSIARYHGVEPFSDEHFDLMRPYYRELAAVGVRTITCTLTDLPWNHQNYDPYHTMIRHVRQADGSWKRNYDVFDKMVRFADECGIGPEIHCYTMVTWGDYFHYEDAQSGDRRRMKLVSGTGEHAAFWKDFLVDFERHLKSKGWAERTFIGVDERSPAELAASVALVRRHAPSLRIQMAINRSPSAFDGITIDGCTLSLSRVNDQYMEEAKERIRQGRSTTYYLCCNPARPNTFLSSPLFEGRWIGLFSARGLSGYARWAVFNWMYDPLKDTTFGGDDGSWTPGDSFLIYPGPRMSTRWEMMRDGIENFEKIRMLRESGEASAELEAAIKAIDYREIAKLSDEETAKRVEAVERLLEMP
jgi:hypothetical protein